MKKFLKEQSVAEFLWLVLVAASVGCQSAPAKQAQRQVKLNVFAAAGARLATDEICDAFAANEHVQVERNYASSGTLARQIAAGAEGNVFISANRQWMEFLEKKQLLKPGTQKILAQNALVVIAPKGSYKKKITFSNDFPIGEQIERIAVGDPAYVPVGKYTDEVFQKLGWTEQLAEKRIPAKDVSAVLQYVEMGESDLGVVYRSEAVQSTKVDIVAEIPGALHQPIVFYIAELKSEQTTGYAGRLVSAFMDRGKAVFAKYGFLPTNKWQMTNDK